MEVTGQLMEKVAVEVMAEVMVEVTVEVIKGTSLDPQLVHELHISTPPRLLCGVHTCKCAYATAAVLKAADLPPKHQVRHFVQLIKGDKAVQRTY